MDTDQLLAEKENQLTEQERNLDIILQAKETAEKEIAILRIKVSEINLEIKKKEQMIEAFDPSVRQARFNISRMKREHEGLKRTYFQQRDQR